MLTNATEDFGAATEDVPQANEEIDEVVPTGAHSVVHRGAESRRLRISRCED